MSGLVVTSRQKACALLATNKIASALPAASTAASAPEAAIARDREDREQGIMVTERQKLARSVAPAPPESGTGATTQPTWLLGPGTERNTTRAETSAAPPAANPIVAPVWAWSANDASFEHPPFCSWLFLTTKNAPNPTPTAPAPTRASPPQRRAELVPE